MKESISRKFSFLCLAVFVAATFGTVLEAGAQNIKLPSPRFEGPVSVEKALKERRSIRTYKDEPLTLAEVSQILWAAQGVTEPEKGLRTAPSARGGYYLEAYVVAANVTGLAPGLYRYQPKGHELVGLAEGDKKGDLFRAAGQPAIKAAPLAIVLTGDLQRAGANTSMVYLEAGHASENVYLQTVALGLGAVTMAGFKPEEVKKALGLPEKDQPIYILAVGKK
jgi:SagB-type dehydrogenase family enzyme